MDRSGARRPTQLSLWGWHNKTLPRSTCRLCGEEFKVQAPRRTMHWEAIQTAAEAVATDTNDDLVQA